jgi:hypothetical protein
MTRSGMASVPAHPLLLPGAPVTVDAEFARTADELPIAPAVTSVSVL